MKFISSTGAGASARSRSGGRFRGALSGTSRPRAGVRCLQERRPIRGPLQAGHRRAPGDGDADSAGHGPKQRLLSVVQTQWNVPSVRRCQAHRHLLPRSVGCTWAAADRRGRSLAPSGQSRLDSSEAFSSRNVVVDGDLRLDIQIALAGRPWYERGVKLIADSPWGLVAMWPGPHSLHRELEFPPSPLSAG